MGLWVQGLAVSHINESKTLFLMTSLQNYCILGLAEIKTLHYAQEMQDALTPPRLRTMDYPKFIVSNQKEALA